MSERPQAVTYEESAGWTTVLLRTNIKEHTAGEGEEAHVYYTDELTRLVLPDTELTPELRANIEAAPEKYIRYVPLRDRPAMQQQYTDAVQRWMDSTAHTRGYDDIFTAISYADSEVPKFRDEAAACKRWRDRVWVECYTYLDDVLSGKQEVISVEELIARLPQIEW